ncbi:MAG: PQQ-dependent sugar dehydrogenase, partial [Candidatus Promineifilaceae bacterium]
MKTYSRMFMFGWLGLALLIFTACGETAPTATPIAALATAVSSTPLSTSPTTTNSVPTPTLEATVENTAVPPTTAPTATETNPPEPTATAMATAVPTDPGPALNGFAELPGATVPPGFSFIKFADLFRPTSFTFDDAGRLFVTSFDGTVHILQDVDGDGRSDSDTQFASGYRTALGITRRPGTTDFYLSSTGKITLLRDDDGDDVAEVQETVVSDLPFGLHQNDNLKFGPDGWLYLGIGSTCDACAEADSRSATLMRFNVDTGESEIVATGLRNPYDLAFHPVTGDLFATDNGRDDLGLDSPFEELNQIVPGGDYGWPSCWNAGEGSNCAGTETAVAIFAPHSSANGLDFYSGSQFPA